MENSHILNLLFAIRNFSKSGIPICVFAEPQPDSSSFFGARWNFTAKPVGFSALASASVLKTTLICSFAEKIIAGGAFVSGILRNIL